MTQLIGKQLGRYKIQQEIGRGGMARVYRGLDTTLQRPVALKVLAPQLSMDPEFARRFNREAVIAANLHHPAIVTIYDIDEYNVEDQFRLHYIAMEFIQGRSLHAILDDRDALGLGYAVSILEPLGRALDYAHSRGAVHRDVKPHNVLIDADGRVLLADFGIAQPPDADTERLTRTGVFMGTPEYISPEQAEARRVDGRSDLYSLGVVAYEIITGRVPFSGATPQLIIAHSQTPPPRPSRIAPHLPPELDAVLMQALAKDPDERFRNGATLVEALRNVAQHHGAPLASTQQIAALVRPQDSAGQPTISLGKGQTPAASLPIPPQQPAAAPAPAPAPRQQPPARTANSRPVPPPVQPPIPPSQPPAPPSQPPAPPPGTGSAGYPPRSPRQHRFSPNQVAVAVALALLGLALLALFVRGSNSDTGIDVAPTAPLPAIETETTEPAAPTDVPPPATTAVPSATSAPPTEAPSPVPPSPIPPSPVPPSPVPPSPVPPTETATSEPPTTTLEPPTATPVLPTVTPILELPTVTEPPEYPPPGTAITNTQPTVVVSTTGTPAGTEATPVPTATAPPQVVATPTATELLPAEPTPTAILQMEPDPTDTDTAEPADLLAGPSATAEGLPPEPSPSPSPLSTATPEAVLATPSPTPATIEPA
ncbi:MAG: protein kinase domain-containing protein [Chloroflexaceae bacterium]